MNPNRKKIARAIITYLIIVFSISTIFYILYTAAVAAHDKSRAMLYIMLLMWCPATSAIATGLIYNRNIRGFGWRWQGTGYALLGYCLPIGYAGITYGAIWLSGLGAINQDFASVFFTLPRVIRFLTIGMVFTFASVIGEEIGWRGFLIPHFAKLTSFTKLGFITGLIWAFWHYPLIIFSNYRVPNTPLIYNLACFTLMVIAMNFVLAWLRLKSGSIWPTVILHTSHNLYIQNFFDPITKDTGITRYFTSEFGIGLCAIITITAFIFWRMRSRLPDIRVS